MTSIRVATVTIKSPAPEILSAFWREFLDYVEVQHPTESIRLDDPSGSGPTLLIQPSSTRQPQGSIHLDLRPEDQAKAIAKAIALGATRAEIGQTGNESWEILADPDGNHFCILQTNP